MSYEVCSEEYLRKIKQVNKNDLSLEEDVFHIIGRPDEVWGFDSYYSIHPKTKDFYQLIAQKGGNYETKGDNKNVTCLIVGSKPSLKTLKKFENKYKIIRSEEAYFWLLQKEDIVQDCREFEKSYHSSEDIRLRPYQQSLKKQVFHHWNNHYNLMLQLPTGTGKTVLFTSIINDLTKVEGTKIIILAHRKELIDQISDHLSRYKIEHGLIVSGRIRRPELNVQVASVQTLTHPNNLPLLEELNPKFIIIDEAHHSLADSYTKFWKLCGNCWKLGVTATPYRLNLKGFRSHFDKLIESESIKDFIKNGFLANYIFLTDNPYSNLSQAIKAIKEKSSTGDYKTETLLRVLNIEEHIQRLILCYEQYVKGKKGIVYAINKEHAKNICKAYQAIGVEAVYIDSDTPKRERKNIVEGFRNNNIKIMVNVDIFSEGFDCPDVEFIQLARPTWSLCKYLQQVGRGMRPSENKEKTVILDNSRMYIKFGLPSDDISWNKYFVGDYFLKSKQGREDVINEKILLRLGTYNEDLMIKINETIEKREYNIVSRYEEEADSDYYNNGNNEYENVDDNLFNSIFGEPNSVKRKIIAAILTAIVFLIAIHFFGLFGVAIIGLIAGFLLK